MKKSFDDYTWLAGGSGVRGSLWRGPDHLLVIQGSGFIFPYRETYRRIDYKNIQALTLTSSRRFAWIAAMFAVPLAGFTLWLVLRLIAKGLDEQAIVVSAPVFVLLVFLLIHLALGKTCVCSLQTAVLSLRLKPLKRMRKGEAVIKQIHELCLAHQGEMPAGALTAQPVTGTTAWFAPPGMKPLFKGSRLAQWGMMCLALWGVALAGEMFVSNVAYLCAHILLAVAALVLIIAGLARTAGHRGAGWLLAILWSSLVLLIMSAVVGYIAAIIVMVPMTEPPTKNTKKPKGSVSAVIGTPTADRILIAMAQYNLDRAGKFGWFIIGLGVVGAALGLAGIPLAAMRRGAEGPAAPPVSAGNIPPT